MSLMRHFMCRTSSSWESPAGTNMKTVMRVPHPNIFSGNLVIFKNIYIRRNVNGAALMHFLEAHNMFLCNTAFSHSAQHKATYQHKCTNTIAWCEVVISNIIDFIVCCQSQKSLLLNGQSYVETVLDSNHIRVISHTRLALSCWNPFKCRQSKTIQIPPPPPYRVWTR